VKLTQALRRLGMGTGLLALVAAAVIVPAGSAAARRSCLRGGVLLAHGAESKLVIKHHKLWGCSERRGTSLVLWDPGGAISPSEPLRPYVTPAEVAGRYAVVRRTGVGSAARDSTITVWNLRTGRGHVAPAVGKVIRLGVTSTGAAVWTATGPYGYDVRAMDVNGVRLLLDSSPRVAPRSLRVRGSGASWTDGVARRTKHFR